MRKPKWLGSHRFPGLRIETWGTQLLVLSLILNLTGCRSSRRDPQTVVFLIESSPTNLDPRVGTDGQSEHIDELIFDGLVAKDSNFHFTPAIAQSWELRDPVTLVFHLREGVRFHDGRPMTARDVVWSINSMRDGTVITPKSASYAAISTVEAPDARTVVVHLKRPDNFLLINLATGAFGVVPEERARFLAASGGDGTVPVCEPTDRPGCSDRAQPAELESAAETRTRAICGGSRSDHGIA